MHARYWRLAVLPIALAQARSTTANPTALCRLPSLPLHARAAASMAALSRVHGDLNNTEAIRQSTVIPPDPSYARRTLAIPEDEDRPNVRAAYRPFLLPDEIVTSDWVAKLELSTALKMAEADMERTGERLRVLMLYGSLRTRSYSRLLTFECARILFRLGCDVRIFDPTGLPVKDDVQHDHAKVQELRELSKWSDGHVWISPEQHGTLTGVFKNQIDWIPLSTGSVRPTQGRTLAVAEVSGGSQSFNAVNMLRILGRWMRMFTIPNQSSIPKAYTTFTDIQNSDNFGAYVEAEGGSRLMPSGNRDRVVDCMEEFAKYTIIMRSHFDLFNDRSSERVERLETSRKAECQANGANGVKDKAGEEGNAKTMASANVVNGIDVAGI